MRHAKLAAVAMLVVAGTLGASSGAPERDYPATPVPLTDVTFTDAFWAPRLETVRTVTLAATFKQSEDTGRIKNFEIAGGLATGAFCSRYAFDDSDVFKIIEGAAYSLATKHDPALSTYVEGLIAKIAKAQEPDGYLYTARTIDPANVMPMAGKERWINEADSHELYNAGHLYEAAVAYFQATGKRTLLDVAIRNADLICSVFNLQGRRAVPGHQGIELGLVKLYRTTGNRKYLDQAQFFLDQRGKADGHKLYGEYAQDHKPVAEQTEAVGHSVRAAYMYSGMADVAALTGNAPYVAALDRLWDNVVGRKLYLTGGIGATGAWEGFGPDYDLPNSAYAETCASIANALWNHRMFLLDQDGKYFDVYERAVYNAMLSGLSLSGDRFFYPNPLLSLGQHERSPWFACACCPSNLPRFMLSIPGHAYAVAGGNVFVNLYVQGRARIKTASGDLVLQVRSDYPWDGTVTMMVAEAPAGPVTLKWRVPGWAQGRPVPSDLYRDLAPVAGKVSLSVNGVQAPSLVPVKGYLSWERTWKSGDMVSLHLPMPVRRVVAHPSVKADEGRVAVERGPLVYAAEFADNGGRVTNLLLGDAAALQPSRQAGLLGGVTVITGDATSYRTRDDTVITETVPLRLIPYYAWAHRGKGEMAVWLARQPDKARPAPEPTLASQAKASSSEGGKSLQGLNEQYEPTDSNDHTAIYFHWWPKKNSTEWVQYDFAAPATVSEASVYWFDDTGQGECRIPRGWRVLYKRGEEWVPVTTADAYGTAKDRYNTVHFTPVQTTAIRVEVQLPERFSAGIQELKIK